MPDGKHIDLDTLDKYLQGTLAWEEAEAVRRHLETCPSCGLELKRLRRFEAIDSDEGLARKGEWLYARTKLEKALRESIVPAAAAPSARVIRFRRAVRTARWLVPAAAAAAVVIMIAHYAANDRAGSPVPESKRSVMRGAPPVAYHIELKEPLGEIETAPAIFMWKSERKDDYFTLEIFTPKLDRIALQRDIRESSWAMPDSLRSTLKPGVVYLWCVRGYRGLERATASPNGWFKIKP
jgi:hypothetical protein